MVGDELLYTAKIKNNGPEPATIDLVNDNSATFMFYIPKGIDNDPNEVVFTPDDLLNPPSLVTGTMTQTTVTDVLGHVFNVFSVKVEMPVGSSGTFSLPAEIANGEDISLATGDKINAWAAIMRARDIVDPNAFNPAPDIEYPQDPFQEANGIHKNVANLNLAANLDDLSSTDFANLAISEMIQVQTTQTILSILIFRCLILNR